MHEQSFEKQVQQKMDELSLTPSAPVWQKVEEQIRKKKERRRVLFWALPLLLIGGGAYWLLPGKGSTDVSLSTAAVQQRPASAPARLPLPAGESTTATQDTGVSKETTQSHQPATEPLHQNESTATTLTKKINKASRAQTAKQMKQSEYANNPAYPQKGAVTLRKDNTVPQEANSGTATLPDTSSTAQTSSITRSEDTTATTGTKHETPDTTASTAAAPAPAAHGRRWSFAVQAEAGITSVQSGLIPLPSTRDALSAPSANTGGTNFLSTTPLLMQNGPSLSAGFTAKKDLGGRTRLTLGLQYTYYATRSSVGQKITADTVFTYSTRAMKVATHYLPGSENEYTNHFHFVQLPVGIEYRLLRKAPLYLNSGVTVAKLVYSKALLYDYNFNVYYKNSAAFQKMQLHLFTNLTYTVWKRNNREVNLGPYAQYGVTELQKESGHQNRLFSGGLRAQFSF